VSRQPKTGGGAADKASPPARSMLRPLISGAACIALLLSSTPAPLWAQAPAPPPADAAAPQTLTAEQLDAMMAPIALYPDEILAQIMMASAFPLQVVAAARWAEDPANKALTGDALTAALAPLDWDPSVKSLVPFPQVLAMVNEHLDWLQQIGFAVNAQQSDVLVSVQRLRKQAQIAGQLKSNEQQVVRTEGTTIIVAPAQPNVVYVPVYNPTVVYGAWPYPAYPPAYLPPPPGYVVGAALATGVAFSVGIGVTAGLWGWARPGWNTGYVNVNVNRYNTINVNRPPINNPAWRGGRPTTLPAGYRPAPAGGYRPPAGGFNPPGSYRPPAGGPGATPRPPGTLPGRPGTPPGRPGATPRPPGTLPGKPGTAPGGPGATPRPPGTLPGKPGTAPGGPGATPRPPGTLPGKPGTAPGTPGTSPRPPGSKPGTRPGTGTGKPGAPSAGRPGGGTTPPGRPGGPPAAGGGRPGAPPSGGIARPPGNTGPGSRPPRGQGGTRPGGGQIPPGAGGGTRPGRCSGAGGQPGAGQMPSGTGAKRPNAGARPGGGPPGGQMAPGKGGPPAAARTRAAPAGQPDPNSN